MSDPADDVRVKYVKVYNGLDVAFTDRFDGVPVSIPPGKTENFPIDMAQHFFGYHPGVDRMGMLRHVARRQGWNTPEYVKQDAVSHKTLADEYFDKLKIEPVLYKLVQVDADTSEPIPADPQPEPVNEYPVDNSARQNVAEADARPPRRVEVRV